MSGWQITVKKRALLDSLLPTPPALGGGEEARHAELAELARALAAPLSPADRAALDRRAHLCAAALFGRSAEEAESDLLWWQARSRGRGE